MTSSILLAFILVMAVLMANARSVNKPSMKFKSIFNKRDPFPEPNEWVHTTPTNIILQNVTQRVDNFNPLNVDTWQQRYYSNSEFYSPGGPIFLFLSGEWTITPYRLTYSHMATMARELNGHIFYLEHRYYGESRPVANVTNDNLRFLSPEQALADTAHFIEHIKSITPGAANSHVILIGGHYSGSLAVWFRQKYPHLALGAWASSSPLLSVVNHFQYKVNAAQVYRDIGGESCYERLENGFAEMEQMIDDGEQEEISELFRLCDTLDSEDDIGIFFTIIAELFSFLPQFGSGALVADACELIQNTTVPSDAHGIALLLHTYLPENECLPIDYEYIVESDRQTSWDAISVRSGFRQWSYQLCSQIGWFHSSDSDDQPFGNNFPVDIYYKSCVDVFGADFTAARLNANSERLNAALGGLSPDISNVAFVHGELDPWRTIGILEDQNESSPAIIIEGASMGNDLGPITDEDSEQLVAAKLRITALVRAWIADADINVVPY